MILLLVLHAVEDNLMIISVHFSIRKCVMMNVSLIEVKTVKNIFSHTFSKGHV